MNGLRAPRPPGTAAGVARTRNPIRLPRNRIRGRRAVLAVVTLCGLVLLYLLPLLKIPLVDTPQVSFASVLFFPVGIYVLLALGLDMMVGRTGQLNLGYAAFFAAGAYTTGLLSTRAGMPYYATIVPAVLVSMVLGLVVGVVSLRVSGDYFAIVTLGIGLVIQEVIANVGIFGTTVGMSSIPPPGPLAGLHFSVSNPKAYDWLVFTMIIVVGAVFAVLYRSSVGRAWSAIREDEGAAELMGVKVRQLKVLASTIGAAPGGLAGSIYAAQVGYISPDTFGLTLSIFALASVIIGGKGRLVGIIVGAVLVGYLPERFLAVNQIDTLLFGIVLVLVMLFRPEGIVGALARGRSRAGDDAAGTGPRGSRPALPAPGAPSASPPDAAGTTTVPRPAAPGPAGGRSPGGTAEGGVGAAAATLVVEHARVTFGGVVALDDASLAVAPGTVTSVIGPNGAGKTTLVNAVTGVYRLQSGRVLLRGRDVTDAPIARRSGQGLGRTFQNIRLFGAMTALENVLVAAEAVGGQRDPGRAAERRRRASRDEITARARGLLDAVGLSPAASTRSDRLPYGAQRRLEMARALALDPAVLLLDEPAAGANTAEKRELTDLIGTIAQSGRSVLLIEHDVRLVMEISARIVVLNFGRVIADGTPGDIRKDPAVIAAYLGERNHA